jgi:hypothetical protein
LLERQGACHNVNMQKHTPEVVLSEVIVRQVAAASLAPGCTPARIAEQTGLSLYQVRKVMAREDFKKYLKDLAEEALAPAKAKLRNAFSNMADSVISAMENNLAENNMEAVKVALKVMGMMDEEKVAGDTQINVVLPGAQVTKEVTSEVVSGIEVQDNQD